MRKAFSMITAIFIIFLMAGLSVFILNISQKSISTTIIQYKKEQAVLWAKSYTELAIMAATANDSNVTNCTETITGFVGEDQIAVNNGEGYDINTTISYIGNDLKCSTTHELNDQTIPIITPNSLHIIVDVFVRYKNPAANLVGSAPWITYHRRTLQKL